MSIPTTSPPEVAGVIAGLMERVLHGAMRVGLATPLALVQVALVVAALLLWGPVPFVRRKDPFEGGPARAGPGPR